LEIIAKFLINDSIAGLWHLEKLFWTAALVACAALTLALTRIAWRRRLVVAAAAPIVILVAAGTFVALDPTLTARPPTARLAAAGLAAGPRERWVLNLPGTDPHALVRQQPLGRFLTMLAFRKSFSAVQQEFYPTYALQSLADKLKVVLVQGFGRFSPFGPAYSHLPARYDWQQDRWCLIWLPWVALGVAWAVARGRRQVHEGRPPTAWGVLLYAAIAWACVTLYLPLAWDRYLLPIQPPAALLAAAAAVSSFDHVVGWLTR
jgi:hypothetical protein